MTIRMTTDRSTISVFPVHHERRWVVKNLNGQLVTVPQFKNDAGEWMWRVIDCIPHGSADFVLSDIQAHRHARESAHYEREQWA